ncbi:MAG: DUF4365 domain-containing protein, partial [Ignavibacteriaceae bacterium]
TIAQQHKIDFRAKKIFEGLMPDGWLIRPQIPDYHVDYFIELEENSEPSGIFFFVQLKGSENIKIKKGLIKFSFSTKQLKYYLERLKDVPLFIVLVDINSKKVYWLFIQKYLTELKSKHWKTQKFLTLNILQENLLEDSEIFKKKITDANNYMRELWPSSTQAALKKEFEYFQSLDPRFKEITLSMQDDIFKYHFHSDDSFNLQFKVKDGNKLEEHLKNPDIEKLILKSDEVEIIGSDLMNELLKKSDNIELNLKQPTVNIDVFLLVGNNNLFTDFLHLNGKLSYHNKLIKINCTQNNLPFRFQVILNRDENNDPTFNFNFDFTVWINKPVQSLPYLEKLHNYFSKIKEGMDSIMKIGFQGDDFLFAKFKMQDANFLQFTNSYFPICKKLKYIDSHYKLNLLFPGFDKLKESDIDDIEELYNLLTTGEHIEKRRKLTGNFTVEKKDDFLKLYFKGMDIRLISDGRFNFLGKEINIGKNAIDISHPNLLISYDKMEKLFKSNRKYIQLKFTTNEKSIVTYRLLKN